MFLSSLGRALITESLRTKDFQEAVRKVAKRAAEDDLAWKALRKTPDGAIRSATDAAARQALKGLGLEPGDHLKTRNRPHGALDILRDHLEDVRGIEG